MKNNRIMNLIDKGGAFMRWIPGSPMGVSKPVSSLRRKIALGYAAISGLIMFLAAMAFLEMLHTETRIKSVSTITDFLNAILEMRRYEKNFFLFKQESDWEANRQWLIKSRTIFSGPMVGIDAVVPKKNDIKQNLDNYGKAMGHHVQSWKLDLSSFTRHEEGVRRVGKALATTAEELALSEKKYLFQSLEGHRHIFLGVIAILALIVLIMGHMMINVVTKPLKNMELTLRKIAQGHMNRIIIPSRDLEIQSLTMAFNRMLIELRTRQQHMVRSEKLASLGTMLSGVAHELNNPLSNIATSCQILLEETPENSFHREMLAQIDSQTLRARDIVRSLLDFARDQPFHRQRITVNLLVEETLRLLSSEIITNITVERQIPHTLTVDADRQRLQQVLLNLIKNGLDALSGRGVMIISGQRLPCLPESLTDAPNRFLVAGDIPRCSAGSVVELSIKDNGMGIEPSLLPRILDPFFTTKEVGQGSGLGLFVAYGIIEEHNGCLVVESEQGVGSTFRVYLPDPVTPH